MLDPTWNTYSRTSPRASSQVDPIHNWRRSTRRGIVLGLALALHLGLLLVLLLPPAAMRALFARNAGHGHVIDVRLIDNPSAWHPPPQTRLAEPPSRTPPAVHQPALAARPSASSESMRYRMPQGFELAPLPTATAPAPYVAGGAFAQRLQHAGRAPAAPVLPGSSQPIVPGLHMVDPRTQGAAGVVRFIGGIFGAENPHCVDVDAWQHMTPQQLAARDLTPNEVTQVAEQNHCVPQAPTVADHLDYQPGIPRH